MLVEDHQPVQRVDPDDTFSEAETCAGDVISATDIDT